MNDNNSDIPAATEPQQTIFDRAWAPCDVASVAFIRVVISLTFLAHVAVFFYRDGVEYYFGRSEYHLTYFGFEWVRPLGPDGMRRLHYLMALAAVGVGLGLLYRISAALLFVTFTYTFLSEAALFQNHYYLMSLLAFLLNLIPAHRGFSVDAVLVPDKASPWIPGWCRWLLMFQIGIPYIFGGIAKINRDWLHGMPVLYWLEQNRADMSLIGPLVSHPAAGWFICYFGLIFDLAAVPLLLWKRTRILAFGVATAFHLSNATLFNIDVFPWMMIPAATIFFPADWPRKILRLNVPDREPAADGPARQLRHRITTGIVLIFVTWQLLFPLRHWLYPGNPAWTEEGQLFAWRMMLRHKSAFFVLYATDSRSGRMVEVPLPRLMTPKQMYTVSVSPDQLVACAPFLAAWAREEHGFQQAEIRAFVLTSLNGRVPQFQMDPELNLLTIRRSIWPQPGILPLEQPLRKEPWDVPVHLWLEELDISLPVSVPVTD